MLDHSSLRNQILYLVTGLSLITTAVVVIVMLRATASSISETVNEDIERALRGLEDNVLLRSEQLLALGKPLLANKEFGDALADVDERLLDLLDQRREIINSDLLFVVDSSDKVLGASGIDLNLGRLFKYPKSISEARQQGVTADFLVFGNHIYQVLMLTATPLNSGDGVFNTAGMVVGIGAKIDAGIAQALGELTGVDITVFEQRKQLDLSGEELRWIFASSFSSLYDVTLALNAPTAVKNLFRIPFSSSQPFISRELKISETDDTILQVMLTRSLVPYYENFETLRDRILQIAFVVLLLALAGSYFVARNLTVPLNKLAQNARLISAGQYKSLPDMHLGSREVSSLVDAFTTMNQVLREREQRIRFQATHDSMTGLYNRDYFYVQMEKLIESTPSLLLIGINLRGFDTVNHSFGIDVGDKYLIEIAKRIKAMACDGIAARIGGADFCLVLNNNGGSDQQHWREQAENLHYYLAEPLFINGISLSVEPYLSMVSYPDHADTIDLSRRRLSVAMDHNKSIPDSIFIFQHGLDTTYQRKLKILRALKVALLSDDDQLSIYYQPKLNLKSNRIEKAEALLRWYLPGEGSVSPELFVSLAEQTGLISQLTEWVVSKVFKHQRQLQQQNIHMQLSINMSAQDLSNDSLREFIEAQLKINCIDANNICLEITERDVMTHIDKSKTLLNAFKNMGFKLSIDDYGVGYSALSKLATLPVDELKIDKCFINNLANNHANQVIVDSTITMAHQLGLTTIAEGVEDITSMEWLAGANCDYIQGFMLAKPMPFNEVSDWIENFHDQSTAPTIVS